MQVLTDEERNWLKENAGDDLLQRLGELPANDNRRLAAMNWNRIATLLRGSREKKREIAEQFHVMEDLCFLSRSSSTTLKNDDPLLPPVSLSNLMKKHHVFTVGPVRTDREEAEYQNYHLPAARYYDSDHPGCPALLTVTFPEHSYRS